MASAHWQLRYWQNAEVRFFNDGPGNDPVSRVCTLDALSQRQARYERALGKAYELYKRSDAAKPSRAFTHVL